MTIKKTFKFDESIVSAAQEIAASRGSSVTAVFESAIKLYRDFLYMNENATFIPEQFQKQIKAALAVQEKRMLNKTNQIISELAIQQAMLSLIIANNLEIPADILSVYRRQAIEFLKVNNRVFRLDEMEQDE